MRMPFLRWVMGVILAALAGGCGASQEPAGPRPPSKPTSVGPPRLLHRGSGGHHRGSTGHQWAGEDVILGFEIVDDGTRAPIDGASVEIINPYSEQIAPTQSTWTDGRTRLVAYNWWMYAREEGLPPESYFLGDLWLQVTAPGYKPVKVSLRKFVGERRAIDEVPWIKSRPRFSESIPSPLIVSLRKGERKPPQGIHLIAGNYRGDRRGLVLDIYGDGTFRIYDQHQHGRNPAGFGFAEILDGKLKPTYAESGSRSEGNPQMTALVAEVDSVIKERSP